MDIELILTFLGIIISIYSISSENNKLTFRFKINSLFIGFIIVSFLVLLFELISNKFHIKILFLLNLLIIIYIFFYKKINKKSDFIDYLNQEIIKGNFSNVILLMDNNFETINENYKISKKYDKIKNNLFRNKDYSFIEKIKILKNKKNFNSLFSFLDELHSNDDFIKFMLKNNINLSLKLLTLDYRGFPHMFWRKYFKILMNDKNSRIYSEFKSFNTSNKIIKNKVFENKVLLNKLKVDFELFSFISNKFDNIEKIDHHEKEVIQKMYSLIIKNKENPMMGCLTPDYLKEILIEDNSNIHIENLKIIFSIYIHELLVKNNKEKEILFQMGYDLLEIIKSKKYYEYFFDYYFTSLYLVVNKDYSDKKNINLLIYEILNEYNKEEKEILLLDLKKYKNYTKCKEVSFYINPKDISKLIKQFKNETKQQLN